MKNKKFERITAVDKYLGMQLKAIRTARNLSQSELGKKIGITFQQIQKYEQGINRISSANLYLFTKIFNLSLDYFFRHLDLINEREEKQDKFNNEEIIW